MTEALSPAPERAVASAPAANRWSFLLGGMALVLLVGVALVFAASYGSSERTDDAYVEAHLASVISKVPSYVQALHVDDNAPVRAGELLVELDPRDYAIQFSLAQANLATAAGKVQEALNQITVADAAIRQQRAELGVASAAAEIAGANLQRLRSVSDARAVSSERLDEARTTLESARASVDAARVKVDAAQAQASLAHAQAGTAKAFAGEAQANLDQAKLNLSYTRIYASETGSIAHKTVENGNFIQPGQVLMSIIPRQVFVIANYKETQLANVRPGQAVDITVDAFGNRRMRGHVDSIQRGSGSRFALLPPENATGNFVKVVQRIPVKIAIDEPADALRRLSPGMSVETEIYVGGRSSWLGTHP